MFFVTHLLFSVKCLSTESGKIISWIISSTNKFLFSVHGHVFPLAIDTVVSIIKYLISSDWLFEVTASLWDVLLDNGSIPKLRIKIIQRSKKITNI